MRSECRVHDGLVVKSIEEVIQNTSQVPETLTRSVADYPWRIDGWEEALECFRVLDTRGIVESENTKDIPWFQTNTRLLDKLKDTVLRSGQRHIHLHDLEHVQSGFRCQLKLKAVTSISA